MRLLTVFMTTVTLTLGLATAGSAQASTIRDTEIENTIRYYNAKIFEAAGLNIEDVQIFLVNDDRLNAFVSGGQRIFINTGLLMAADTADQVIGVMAHETGHITGGHLAQFDENIRNAQAKSLAALIIGVPIAILSGQPEAVIASQQLGQQIGNRSFLEFTRTMERSADQAAVQFLDSAGYSSKGLLEFFEILKRNEALYSANQNPYIRSHPLTNDRIQFVENHVQISKYTQNQLPEIFDFLHKRMKAKLIGYLKPDQVDQHYPASDQSAIARYARAIALMRKHKTEEALEITRGLMSESPEDPYFIELEGDILFKAGRMEEAIDSFERTLEILDWAALIRRSVARAYIEKGEDEDLLKAVSHLERAMEYEPASAGNWKWMVQAYGKLYTNTGDKKYEPELALAEANYSVLRREFSRAKFHAKKAMELLPAGSAAWLQAQDIEIQANKGEIETQSENTK